MKLSEQLMRWTPYWLQDLAVTTFNTLMYRQRHSGEYQYWLRYFAQMQVADAETIRRESEKRLREFIAYARENSTWYDKNESELLSSFPVLEKTDIVANLDVIATVRPRQAISSMTGGTTGASLKVYYTKEDMQHVLRCLISLGVNTVIYLEKKRRGSAEVHCYTTRR